MVFHNPSAMDSMLVLLFSLLIKFKIVFEELATVLIPSWLGFFCVELLGKRIRCVFI